MDERPQHPPPVAQDSSLCFLGLENRGRSERSEESCECREECHNARVVYSNYRKNHRSRNPQNNLDGGRWNFCEPTLDWPSQLWHDFDSSLRNGHGFQLQSKPCACGAKISESVAGCRLISYALRPVGLDRAIGSSLIVSVLPLLVLACDCLGSCAALRSCSRLGRLSEPSRLTVLA